MMYRKAISAKFHGGAGGGAAVLLILKFILLVAEFYAIVAPLPTQMRRLTLAHLDWTFSPAPFQTPLLLDPDETRNALQMELSNYAT